MEIKNPKLTYEIKGETISSELDEKTLNEILQSVLLQNPNYLNMMLSSIYYMVSRQFQQIL